MFQRRARNPYDSAQVPADAIRLVHRTLPSLLDELDSYRAPTGDTDRVRHVDPAALAELRSALEREGSGLSLHAIDVIDYVAHLQRSLRQANDRLVERTSLHDELLAKDFLALYGYARAVVDPHGPVGDVALEGLQLQLDRLAPLADDVRMRLAQALDERRKLARLPFVLQGAVPTPPGQQPRRAELDPSTFDEAAMRDAERAWPYLRRSALPRGQTEALPLVEVACQLVDAAVETGMVTAAHVTTAQNGDVVVVRLARSGAVALDPAHTVRVQQPDGSIRVECDHKFVGTSDCVRCRKPFAELKAELDAERERLRQTDVEVVSIALGPTLRARAAAVVGRRLLGESLGAAVQGMFILGLLEAEGLTPEEYVGEPVQHISHDASFVRFALPLDPSSPRRREVLQNVFAWMHAVIGEGDPLAAAPAAALAALPR